MFSILGNRLNGADFVPLGIWLLVASFLLLSKGIVLNLIVGATIVYLVLLFSAGSAFYLPLALMINLYLLWWNPEKYKEYDRKKRRQPVA